LARRELRSLQLAKLGEEEFVSLILLPEQHYLCSCRFLLTGRFGSGLVIARLGDGTWSAPSAIAVSGVGWGFQAGGELTDVMLVLTTTGAVDAFCSNAQISVGTELAVSLGPVGRSAGTDLTAGDHGTSAAFSCTSPLLRKHESF
jgi:lipid-binding SYLF domain-containing protein